MANLELLKSPRTLFKKGKVVSLAFPFDKPEPKKSRNNGVNVLTVVLIVMIIVAACFGPRASKAHSAVHKREPAGCKRIARSDTVSVACKLSGIVQYSFMARATRPGGRISHTYVCDTASPTKGAGGIDAPAYAEKTAMRSGSYYDRVQIRTPDWDTWICTIKVSVDASPSPIRPQLQVSILRAVRV